MKAPPLWRRVLGIYAVSMAVVLAAEANNWDRVAAVAAAVGAVGVLGAIAHATYRRITRGKRLIILAKSPEFRDRNPGLIALVVFDVMLGSMDPPEMVRADAWLKRGRFTYPLELKSFNKHPLISHRMVAEFALAPELMPTPGPATFCVRMSLANGGRRMFKTEVSVGE